MTRPVAWALGVALALACASACGSAPGTRRSGGKQLWSLPELGILLVQPDDLHVSAIDPKTGSALWSAARSLPPDPPFGKVYPPALGCPPLVTALRGLVLHFWEGIYMLDPKRGQILWKQRIGQTLCAAVTPDSGVVVVTGKRKSLTKFDASGNVSWKVPIPIDAPASYGPVVLPVSGDIVVRIGAEAMSFSPEGQVNWTRPVSQVAALAPDRPGADGGPPP